jgi:MarR family transcriptional regulator, organic hydroperoxide resistance regulator
MKHGVRTQRRAKRGASIRETQATLRHWREAVPNDRLAHLVKDAARVLLRALQLRLTAHGVSLGHWTFLRILWEKDGITQRELSEQAGVMEPTTTSALNAMERLSYVVRRKMPGNKKKVFVFLTPRGRLLKAKLVPFAEQVNEVAIHNVKVADIITTRRTLLAIIENLAADEASSTGRIPSTRELARLVAEHGGSAGRGMLKRAAR